MTAFHSESSIGDRIQTARKQRGFRSARDLADAIPGGNITEAILQNIEAGRKTDLSVSQLLNIALALRVAPAFLLAPLGRPGDPLDLPNLSREFSEMNVVEFESWFSGASDGAYRWSTADERNERSELQALRELDQFQREQKRLIAMREIERTELASMQQEPDLTGRPFEERIDDVTMRIEQLRTYLESANWELPSTPSAG